MKKVRDGSETLGLPTLVGNKLELGETFELLHRYSIEARERKRFITSNAYKRDLISAFFGDGWNGHSSLYTILFLYIDGWRLPGCFLLLLGHSQVFCSDHCFSDCSPGFLQSQI